MRNRWLVFALIVGVLAFVAAGCGGDDGGGGAEGSEDVTGEISVMAIWSGEEQEPFQEVIDGFNELYPNVTVKYTSGGDNLAPLLSTAVEGGNPPDLAAIAQPGLMRDFQDQDAIKPMDNLRDAMVDNFGESVTDVGAIDGTQYGLFEGGQQVDDLVRRSGIRGSRRRAARDMGRAQRGPRRWKQPGSPRTRSVWTSVGR